MHRYRCVLLSILLLLLLFLFLLFLFFSLLLLRYYFNINITSTVTHYYYRYLYRYRYYNYYLFIYLFSYSFIMTKMTTTIVIIRHPTVRSNDRALKSSWRGSNGKEESILEDAPELKVGIIRTARFSRGLSSSSDSSRVLGEFRVPALMVRETRKANATTVVSRRSNDDLF